MSNRLAAKWDVPPAATEFYDHSNLSSQVDAFATETENRVNDPVGSVARLPREKHI